MEESTKPNPSTGLIISILLVIVVSVIVTKFICRAAGIPSSYALSIGMIVQLLALYPFLNRLPTPPERPPLSFPRWILLTIIGAILMFVGNSLIEKFL